MLGQHTLYDLLAEQYFNLLGNHDFTFIHSLVIHFLSNMKTKHFLLLALGYLHCGIFQIIRNGVNITIRHGTIIRKLEKHTLYVKKLNGNS